MILSRPMAGSEQLIDSAEEPNLIENEQLKTPPKRSTHAGKIVIFSGRLKVTQECLCVPAAAGDLFFERSVLKHP